MSETEEEGGKVAIVRDPTFARIVADDVVVIDRGLELELSMITNGLAVQSQSRRRVEDDIALGYEMTPALNETALVRMPIGTGVSMAMNILERLIKGDKVHGDRIIETISSWVAEAERLNSGRVE